MSIDPIIIHENVKQMGYQVLWQQNVYGKWGLQVLGHQGIVLLGVYSTRKPHFS